MSRDFSPLLCTSAFGGSHRHRNSGRRSASASPERQQFGLIAQCRAGLSIESGGDANSERARLTVVQLRMLDFSSTQVARSPLRHDMKQLLQQVSGGEIKVVDVPAPKLLAGCVLVRTAASLVSVGTERASSEFARKNLLQKARMRPDLVREVLSKINRDGLLATVSSVRNRLDQPCALGYSSAGTVVAVGEGVADINPGDRVACAGAGHAVHAEFACVPRLLVARIPSEAVSFDDAAFTTLGAVALHGVRNADVKLGDIVAVIGLGLLGQLTVQILKAAGCCVVGMDISEERVQLALRLGADAVSSSSSGFQDLCMQHSARHGV